MMSFDAGMPVENLEVPYFWDLLEVCFSQAVNWTVLQHSAFHEMHAIPNS